MKTITANCSATGHLRYGKLTLELTDAEYEEFIKADRDDQENWLVEGGVFELTDFERYGIDEVYDIKL